MNVVFLSPHFPPNFQSFPIELARCGATVLAIGDTPFENLNPVLQDALTEYYFVEDMAYYDSMLRALGWFTHKYGKIGALDSLSEYWLGLEAQLREDFNIPGQRPEQTEVNRSKWNMKQVFIDHDIPCARGELVQTWEQVTAFARYVGYPIILKPDTGVGASATYKVQNDEELASILPGLPAGYVVEEMLSGDLVSFDGLTDKNGDTIFFTSHRFNDGIMDIVNSEGAMHYYSVRELEPELETLGLKTLKAFDIKGRFFHIEYWKTDEGYKAMEVNVRPPGGFTVDMMNFSCDISLYHLWARMITNSLDDFTFERKYHVCHASRRDKYDYVFDHSALLEKLEGMVAAHMPIPQAYSGAMGDYTYLLRHEDEKELLKAIERVERRY